MDRGPARRVVFVVAVGLAIAGVFAVPRVHSELSSDALLQAVQQQAVSDVSGRFSGYMTFTGAADESAEQDGLGSQFTMRGRLRGEVQDAHDLRIVSNFGAYGVEEMIIAGGDLYHRAAATTGMLRGTRFGKYSLTRSADSLVTTASALDFVAVVDQAEHPVKVSRRDGHTTLRVQVDPDNVFSGAAAHNVKSISATLVVTDDGELVSLRERIKGTAFEIALGLTFTDWHQPVTVALPRPSDVDLTPKIDEEGIAAYQASGVYMPKALPSGWTLAVAQSLPATEDFACDQVLLSYTPDSDAALGFVDIYVVPADCAGQLTGSPYEAGPYKGVITEGIDDLQLIELRVDDRTVLQVETNESSLVTDMLKDLVPLDLGTPPAATSPAELA